MPLLNGAAFVYQKASLFHKLNPYLKWKRGLIPLFQTFSSCSLTSLNQAAAFRQCYAKTNFRYYFYESVLLTSKNQFVTLLP